MIRESALFGYERANEYRNQSKGSVQSSHIFEPQPPILPTFANKQKDKLFVREILLPKLEKYPIGDFSSVNLNFAKAAKQHPNLAKQFLILDKLQHHCLASGESKLRSICLLRKLDNRTYIQVTLSSKEENLEKAKKTLDYIISD